MFNIFNCELLSDYAVDEVTVVANHFSKTLKNANPNFSTEEALDELKLMKKVLYKGVFIKICIWYLKLYMETGTHPEYFISSK